MIKNYTSKFILSAFCAILLMGQARAAVWTWKGSAGSGAGVTSWNQKNNWTVVPSTASSMGSNDVVIIPPGMPSYPKLGGNTTIGRVELRGGQIDITGVNLNVSDSFLFMGGTIVNSASSGSDYITLNHVRVAFNGRIVIPNDVKIYISGGMLFQKGIVEITPGAGNDLEFSATASVSGASNKSFLDAKVLKTGNSAFVFPVGDGLYYAGIGISAPVDQTEVFSAVYYNTPFSSRSVSSPLDHVSVTEHWILDHMIGASSVNVSLTYQNPRSGEITEMNDLKVARFNGSTWVSEGGTATGTLQSGSVLSNPVGNFSPFTLGSVSLLNPLPVSLLNFRIEQVSQEAVLHWTTANEINNDFFTLERSSDGKNWEAFATVDAGLSGSEIRDYSSTDFQPLKGQSYYRIRQTDLNGTSTVYPMQPFTLAGSEGIVAWPNPASEVLNLQLPYSEFAYSILDAEGRLVQEAGVSERSAIDVSALGSGVYSLLIRTESGEQRLKFIRQ